MEATEDFSYLAELDDDEKGFSVEPMSNCPHIKPMFQNDPLLWDPVEFGSPCKICKDATECWLCLTCYNTYCSRYVKGHGREHWKETGHCIHFSFQDLSFWCHECEAYIKSEHFTSLYYDFHLKKFGCPPGAAATLEDLQTLNTMKRKITPGMTLELFVKPSIHEGQWEIDGLPSDLLQNRLIDQILGCIYGQALGDAFGLATEFMTASEIEKVYPDGIIPFPKFKLNSHNSRWQPGDWTDDTDQMILILECLLEKSNPDPLLFAEKLKRWVYHGFPELGDKSGMGLGMTVGKVVSHRDFGSRDRDTSTAAREVWEELKRDAAPNGALMRTCILGIWEFQDENQVLKQTQEICHVTHFDSRCVASCVVITTLISAILRGKIQDEESRIQVEKDCVQVAIKFLDPKHHEEFRNFVEISHDLDQLCLDEPKSIGYTFKCLGAALWAFHANVSFDIAMNEIALHGGDADTNACVAGALLGTLGGYSQLPKEWLRSMPNKRWLDAKVIQLLKLMSLV
eukprot:TRINITY_DN6407_c0_g1_i1.p1 TRINITY_DN6407_c0_g1~~TRINITY_DN6407_c0_g1_i1.p1  ORF type:complete len:513 (-),score=158.03 TRINITY_DN6407_c0_g1_i1:26-1564(-)